MAIYVYRISDGRLFSYCPDDTSPVAPQDVLAAQGLAIVSGLAPLDSTHAWDVGSKTVIVVVPPKSIPSALDFWKRFTATEREAIEGLYLTGTQAQKNAVGAFFRYVQAAGGVDCGDAYVQAKVQQLETIGILTAGRAAQILV